MRWSLARSSSSVSFAFGVTHCMSNSEDLVITCVPSLVAVLLKREREKGSPLTDQEVLAVRDGCTAVALPRSQVAKLAESRGYDDIDPHHCWEQWQEIRTQLHEKPDAEPTGSS